MSDDLVEKVARAIRQAHFAAHSQSDFGYPHAAAAIAAVAEWLDNSHKLDDDSRVSLALSKQLEAKE